MKIKDKIYISVLLLSIVTLYIILNIKFKNEKDRLVSNYVARIETNGRQEELKMNEYKKYHEQKYDSLLQELDIKRKNIETIVVTKYIYKDTVVKVYKTIYDTIKNIDNFDIFEKCYTISGEYFEGFIKIKNILMEDKISTFTYKTFDKKFLFIKWKPYYTTKVYSECKKDTIRVEENIKIIKN